MRTTEVEGKVVKKIIPITASPDHSSARVAGIKLMKLFKSLKDDCPAAARRAPSRCCEADGAGNLAGTSGLRGREACWPG